MKNKIGKWMTICFFLLLLLPNLAGFLIKKENVNLEKRELAQWPQITADTYEEAPAKIEEYINDHAPFRYETLNLYAKINWELFDTVDHEEVIAGKDGWLFYAGDDSVKDALGLPIFPEETMDEILNKLLAVRARFAAEPENFVLFIAPNKEQVYREYLPDAYASVTGTSAALQLVRYIREHSDIRVVYPLEQLLDAKELSRLYYKMDTHWNRAGGFVGTQTLLGALGAEETELAATKLTWGTDVWRGDLADMAHLPDSEVDDRWLNVSGYLDDIETEEPSAALLSSASSPKSPDRRSLLMVRDSFGENMMPWLQKYFRESTFVHCNYLIDKDMNDMSGDVFVYEIVERNLSEINWWLDQMLK